MSSAPPSENGSLVIEDGMTKKKEKKGLKKLASKVRVERLPPIRKKCRAPSSIHAPPYVGWYDAQACCARTRIGAHLW